MNRRACFTLVCLLFFAAPIFAQDASPAAGSAEKILRQMLDTYAGASSYSDVGTATYRGLDDTPGPVASFRVWFARPNKFRIDASTVSPGLTVPRREVLWADGQKIRSWSTARAVKSLTSVQLVGSGLFGTYAYHVPTLLNEDYAARSRIHQLEEPTVVGEEEFEGTPCVRIAGKFLGDSYELWVGKDDHLVRKIVARYRDHVLEEIHREIAVNQPLPPEVFNFAPEEEIAPGPTSPPSPEPTKK